MSIAVGFFLGGAVSHRDGNKSRGTAQHGTGEFYYETV